PLLACSANRKSLLRRLDRLLVDPGELVDLLDHLPERRPVPGLDLPGLVGVELRVDHAVLELEELHRRNVDLRDLLAAFLDELQLALHLSRIAGTEATDPDALTGDRDVFDVGFLEV